MEPKLPKSVSPMARKCLEVLAARGLGQSISLGGAFGLAHYHEYRETHDVDAWWREPVGREQRDAVIASIGEALRSFGEVRVRSWGDVTSIELERDGATVFSFQIAGRSAQLDDAVEGLWPGRIGIDSLRDLIASPDARQREDAARLRSWYEGEFLDELSDRR